jgi:hypothetical protein
VNYEFEILLGCPDFFLALEQKLKQETKISIKFTSNGFRKFELKIATQRAYILRRKGYSHIFTSNFLLQIPIALLFLSSSMIFI